ncbi:MAG: hypothetical protein E2598_08860 [Sphingobium sp.]|nr:hypothetical protein [Sphingobium sp.]
MTDPRMTDPSLSSQADATAPAHQPTNLEAEKAAREKAAKQRFFALSLFRLSGIAILMVAWAILLGKFSFVSGKDAKLLGSIIATIGLIQTIIVPRVLAGIWKQAQAKQAQEALKQDQSA